MTLLCTLAFGQTYKAALGDLPGIEPLQQMVMAMANQMGVKVEVQKVPMNRMVYMLISKEVDFGMPMIALKDPEKIKQLPFDCSTQFIHPMAFVLYANRQKKIDLASLKAGNTKSYKIESDLANADLFPFALLPSTNPEASLRKIDAARIDGYILGQSSADPVLRALKLTNVTRQLYDNFDTAFALQKGGRGSPVDKFLTDGMKKIKESGEFDKIMGANAKASVWSDWQP